LNIIYTLACFVNFATEHFKLLVDVITGVKFKDGERIIQDQAEHQGELIHQI